MRLVMPKSRNLLAVTLLVLAILPGTVAAFTLLGRGPVEKPADPDFVYNRTVFDCNPPDSLTVTIGSVTTLSDSTTGRQNLISGYPCAPWAEDGPELIYRVDVAAKMELQARLTAADPEVDLDLFLLDDCDSDSCLVGVNTEFTAELEAGIYYLVVDGASSPIVMQGAFDLELVARQVGLPASICQPGGAVAVACADTTILRADETLFGRLDRVRLYDCGTFPKTAGEMWYAVTVPTEREVIINTLGVPSALDPCLWVFTSCGSDAQCAEFVDDNLAGAGESVTLINEGAESMTWYVGVDAVRPPTSEALGSFDIQFQCQSTVPTAKTSLGGVKALYR